MSKFKDEDMKKYGLIKGKESKGCLMCYNQTPYIEVCSEAYFCSSECHDEFYKQYSEHIANTSIEEL